MRKIVYIVLSFFLLIGCGESRVSKQLGLLERFIAMNPDSVYNMLEELEYEQNRLDRADKMHYIVLRAQCHNQLDLPFDSLYLLREAADYYEKNGYPNQKLLSRYLLGRAYHVLGDLPMAVETYYNCLTEIDSSANNLDYVQLSKVHSQLANIYNSQKLPQYEINELRQAERYALKGNDSCLAAVYHELMANSYDLEGCYDSVIVVSLETSRLYENLGMKSASARAMEGALFPYIQQGRFLEAKRCIDIYEKESGDVDEYGNVLTDAKIYYHKKGLYYLGINKTDSAEYYFHKLISDAHDSNDLEAAYRGLLMLYRTVDNKDSVGKYSYLYCEANDSSNKRTIAEDITRMKSIYDYTRYKNEAAQKEIQSQKAHKKMLIIAFLSIMLALCALYFFVQYNKRKKDEIGRMLSEYNRVKSLINELEEGRDELLTKHKKELADIEAKLRKKGHENDDVQYDGLDANVVGKFKYVSSLSPTNHDVIINNEDWQLLRKEMMLRDEAFMLFLSKMELSDGERKVAMLIRLRFTDYEIKKIIDAYGSSLTNYKTKINKKLFDCEGCRTLRHKIYTWSK